LDARAFVHDEVGLRLAVAGRDEYVRRHGRQKLALEDERLEIEAPASMSGVFDVRALPLEGALARFVVELASEGLGEFQPEMRAPATIPRKLPRRRRRVLDARRGVFLDARRGKAAPVAAAGHSRRK